ncbi:transcriptional regulator /transcriptional regulator, LysR family [Franzmannia pantelleriensis]|uniref:Transcriptional regulator /transcriptional regulator, LysR family n=1 Tax=Franzmannia pantelleriensis TaxID=48727 RepID=A0A1G9N6T4_9GAMM|nr:LysR family transcriptional regulator [Halomonas pantelleriensis]SDL81545.1 transcriptional regulator /transcriptional regulator, LysR family [Halomonas pantelleriensis]
MLQDLNDALIFAKVVEQGSFIAAARQLHLSKTTVSRKVQALEERLGARLLHRTTRNLSLTEAGAVYFDYCNRIAQDLNQAENAVQRLEDSPRGWLRVTAPFTMCTEFTSDLIREFRERHPQVRIEMVLSNDRLDLVTNQIDVALRVGPLPDSTLIARPLARYRSFVYASDRYIALHGEPSEPADLAHHPALAKCTDQRGQRYLWQLRNATRQVEVEIDPIAIANDPFVLRGLLVEGQGLMLTSEIVACLGPDEQRLHRVLDGWEGPEVELNAVFPGGRLISPKVRTFVDFVVERMRIENLPTAEPWQPQRQPFAEEAEDATATA